MASTCENRYQVISSDLHALLQFYPLGNFQSEQDFGQSGWEQINFENSSKIVLIQRDLGLFVKTFAPATGDRAERLYRALIRVSQKKNLPIPPLLPLGFCDRTFIFQLGEKIYEINRSMEESGGNLYEEIYQLIQPIALQEQLSPPKYFDVIEIKGKKFLADIFED